MENDVVKTRLFEVLKARGMTVHKLEVLCGFSNGSIQRAKTVSVERVKVICDKLDIPVSRLIGEEVTEIEEKNQALQDAFESRPEMKTLFSIAQGCTKKEIEQAIKIIEALKK